MTQPSRIQRSRLHTLATGALAATALLLSATAAHADQLDDIKKKGELVIGVLGTQRQAVMPEVQTFAELGLTGFEEVPYYGLFAPAGTPAATITKISDALAKVVALPDVKERLTAMGLTVGHMPPQQLAEHWLQRQAPHAAQ